MAVSDDGAQSGDTAVSPISPANYQLVLDSLSTEVAVLDGEGRIRWNNKAWQRRFVGDVAECDQLMAQGRYLEACEAALVTQPSRVAANFIKMRDYVVAVRDVINGARDEYSMEYAVPGEENWFRIHVNRCATGNGNVVIQRTGITSDKKAMVAADDARQFLQTLIDLVPTQIVWKDTEGRYQGANHAFLNEAGLSDVIGKTTRDMPWGPRSGRGIHEEEQHLMEVGESQFNHVIALNGADGSMRWVRVDRMPLRDTAGTVSGLLVAYTDITELKRAEAVLSEQALELKRLALVAERTTNAVLIMDEERRIIWANESFGRMSGYSLSDVMGQRPEEILLSPSASPESRETIRRAVASGTGYQLEQLDRHRDGSDYSVEMDHQPLHESGELSGWIAVKRDITERVAMQRRLQEAEQRVRTTIEAANLGLYEVDMRLDTVRPGPGWCHLLGLPVADGAIPTSTYFDRINRDDWATATEYAAKQAERTDALFQLEYRYQHADGDWMWLRDTGRVVERDANGTAIRIVGVISDVTRRRQVREQLQTGAERLALATHAAGIGVWEMNVVTGQNYWDARMREIFGLPADLPDEGIARGLVISMCHPDDAATLRALFQESAANDAGASVEFRIVRPDGAVRHLDMRAIIHRDDDGNVARIVGITMDVTEREQIIRDRQSSQRLESIGQLAAGIAHEINTPTQYIGDNTAFLKDGFSHLLKVLDQVRTDPPPTPAALAAAWEAADGDYLREEIPRAIEQSLEGIQRVSGIVRAMKDFSHPATERTPHDLNRAIQSTLMVASNEWKYVAEVVTDLDPALPSIPVMPGDFNQVILNMVVNAAHAIAAVPGFDGTTKGTITIATRLDHDDAVITIVDSGCGMPDEVRQRIFEPFFTTKEVGRGTGQGLAITHNFITRHDGTINVESAPGQGTTFTLRLPISSEADAAKVA